MFTVTTVGTNRLNIELSGKLDADEMKIALDDLAEKAQPIENGLMLYDVIDFHLPSLGAIAIELSRLHSLLGLMKKFDKAAVLADEIWIREISEMEALLLPGLKVKAFTREQRDDAEAWLEEQ